MPIGDAFFSIFATEMETIINDTIVALRGGGTILYPTDTIWGIGCDARNAEAVERLYSIKQRDRTKSMLVLVPTGTLPALGYSDGRPTTYILPRAIWHDELHLQVACTLPAADGTLGIREPRHMFCQEVLQRLGAPLVSTSANLSGHPSPACHDDIEKTLFERLDYCVPPLAEFVSGRSEGSRIVRIDPDGSTTIIRP